MSRGCSFPVTDAPGSPLVRAYRVHALPLESTITFGTVICYPVMSTFRYSPLFLFALFLVGLSAFSLKKNSESRVDAARTFYLEGINAFRSSVSDLDEKIRGIGDARTSVDEAQDAFRSARAAWKRIEFLTGYLDRFAADKVNGAALVRVNESDLQRSLIYPEGFQVIEELLFADDPTAEKTELAKMTERLLYRVGKMKEFAATVPIRDRYMFEALREGVLRVPLLGLTGFDSPVILNSIPEAVAAMQGLSDGYRLYGGQVKAAAPQVARRTEQLFSEAISYLKQHDDFDGFDRLAFIRSYVNPLYSELLAAHYALGYPTYSQVGRYTRPLRYEAENIFAADALNPFFYSPDPNDFYDERRAELGRLLFFDPVLSHNNLRSCASCHNPDLAFTDGRKTSLDISAENPLGRNAPSMINVAFQSKYFWDGRTEHLEHQIEDVLLNHSEMRATFERIIEKLRQSPEYRDLFAEAFRGTTDTAVTKFGITRSLATYLRSLTAMNSPFDRYARGETEEIKPAVKRGFNLFMGKAKCGTCHFAPTFNGTVPPAFVETETEVLGVPSTPDTVHPVLDTDAGRFSRHQDEIYRRSFKTMTVRNAELTAPYMHNGVFATLEEVVDFYDRGGGDGLGLDVPNQTLPPDRLNLTAGEKSDLVAFMKSLTDTAGTTRRPEKLPTFPGKAEWNSRLVGGEY